MSILSELSTLVSRITTDIKALRLLAAGAVSSAQSALAAAMGGGGIKFFHAALNGAWTGFHFVLTDLSGRIAFGIKESGTAVFESVTAYIASGPAFADLRITPYRSASSLTVATGIVVVRTKAFLAIAPGERRRLVSRSSGAWIAGQVLEYKGGEFEFLIDQIGPITGTYNDWTIITDSFARAMLFDAAPDVLAGVPGQLGWRRDTGQLMVFDGTWQAATSGPAHDAAAVYVSAGQANGIGIGNDGTGGVGPGLPFLTIAAARATYPSARIRLNGLPAAPPLYDAVSLSSNVDIAPVLAKGARIPALTLLNASTATDIKIGRLIVDAAGGTSPLALGSTAGTVTIELNGTVLANYTGDAVSETGTSTRVLLKPRDVEVSATGARGGLMLQNLIAGGVDGIRGRIVLAGHTDGAGGAVRIKAKALGVTYKWIAPYGRVDIATGMTGTTMHYAAQVLNVAGAESHSARWEVHSPVGSPRNGCAWHLSADVAAPLSAENWRTSFDNYMCNVAGGGYASKENEEGANTAAAGETNGGISYRCSYLGGLVSFVPMAGVHGLYAGGRSNSRHMYPHIEKCGFGLALKVTDGAVVEYPLIIDAMNSAIVFKGCKNTRVSRWTVAQIDPAGAGEVYQASSYIASGETSENNSSVVLEDGIGHASFAPVSVIQIDCLADGTGAQPVTMRRNGWSLPAGVTGTAFAWGYAGSGAVEYSSLSAWLAAREPTSKAVVPAFSDVAAGDFRPGESGEVFGLATTAPTYATADYYGKPSTTPGPAGTAEAP